MKKNGGPAFPCSQRVQEKFMDEGGYGRNRTVTVEAGGMTLRDYFAAAALTGFMAEPDERTFNPNSEYANGQTLEEWRKQIAQSDAEFIYMMADAMLEARDK